MIRLEHALQYLHITIEKAMSVLDDNTYILWKYGIRYFCDDRIKVPYHPLLGFLLDKEDLQNELYSNVNQLLVKSIIYDLNDKRLILVV